MRFIQYLKKSRLSPTVMDEAGIDRPTNLMAALLWSGVAVVRLLRLRPPHRPTFTVRTFGDERKIR